jgi:hypothetical protein
MEPTQFNWSTVFTGLAAFGTIAVAIMAIWGEWIRTSLVGPKLRLVEHNFRGTVADRNNERVIFYHPVRAELAPGLFAPHQMNTRSRFYK